MPATCEPIRVFPVDSPEYKRLEAAAALMAKWSGRGVRYKVGKTWFDYGAGLEWTTIIASRENDDSWQALYPAQQERILTADSLEEAVKSYFATTYPSLDIMATKS